MGRNRAVATGLILLSVFFYACGSGYLPVDNAKQDKGRPVRWLKGKADSIGIMLEANKDSITDNFAITLLIPKAPKADSLALSDVRLELTEGGEPPDRYVLQRINFYRHLPSGPRVMLETITGSRLSERQHFDLSEGGSYVLHFLYSKGAIRHYPKKLSIRLEARLSGKMASDSFRVSMDFRRHSEFSVWH